MDDLERVGCIKYEEFFRDYLEANQLCIFSSELTKHWRSRKEWVTDGKPNLGFLANKFGEFSYLYFAWKHLSLELSIFCTIFPELHTVWMGDGWEWVWLGVGYSQLGCIPCRLHRDIRCGYQKCTGV